MGQTLIAVEERIDAPAQQVWATITDTRRYAEWVVNTLEVTRADDVRADAGVRYEERNRIAGPLTGSSRWVVESVDGMRRTVHAGEGIWLAGAMRLAMTVEPDDEATRYRHEFTYEPRLGPLGPVVDLALKPSITRDVRASVRALRALCERERPG
jgi:carbon monoxide dehydrogenase subunit G